MYVLDTLRGQELAPPVYSAAGFILNADEGQELKEQGFLYAYIDVERSMAVPAADLEVDVLQQQRNLTSAENRIFPTVSYQDEVRSAQSVHVQALNAAHNMHEILKSGMEKGAVDSIYTVMQGTIDSLKRNENALLSITRLRKADEYTFTHSVNVAMYAVVLGRRLCVQDAFLPDLALAGFFHDIGKMMVPHDVLNFPGKLSANSYKIMRGHPELGRIFLERYPDIPEIVKTGVIEHHERYDGSGYPRQKKHDEISLVGKILAVVDMYDALSSKRCYKNAYTPSQSLSILYKIRETDFAPGFVENFIDALGVYPVGSLVLLSDKSLAVVTEQHPALSLKPKVVLLVNARGGRIVHPQLLDLAEQSKISIVESVARLPMPMDLEHIVLQVA